MNWFKEVWTLGKMIFKSKPNDHDELQLLPMKHFPFKGYSFMMWCGSLVFREKKSDYIKEYFSTPRGKNTLRHETIHLKQAQLKKTWFKYYWTYIKEWFKGNPFFFPRESAYYTIPFEMEAYANEGVEGYEKNYDGSNLTKYTFSKKERKEMYKEHNALWKEYIKTI